MSKIILRSCDGEDFEFEVDAGAALKSLTIKHMIQDNVIPLPKTSKILAKVIEYCKKHVESTPAEDGGKTKEELKTCRDAEIVKVDHATLLEIILAAYYLNIENLVDLTLQKRGDMTQGKAVEKTRKTFNFLKTAGFTLRCLEGTEQVSDFSKSHISGSFMKVKRQDAKAQAICLAVTHFA
ncbi:hypothetical protein C5167_035702 [Papaver somniferum]|nr:hypothetical protein C5167_035702 [Papaver somniferum]